jgi:hypothetical protein
MPGVGEAETGKRGYLHGRTALGRSVTKSRAAEPEPEGRKRESTEEERKKIAKKQRTRKDGVKVGWLLEEETERRERRRGWSWLDSGAEGKGQTGTDTDYLQQQTREIAHLGFSDTLTVEWESRSDQ